MEIEKNIQPPELTRGRPSKYPFSKMDVGDSVFFDGATIGGAEYKAAIGYGRSRGWKFCVRTSDGGLRVWRVA